MPQIKETFSGLGRLHGVSACVGTPCSLALCATLLVASVSLPGEPLGVSPPAAASPPVAVSDRAVKPRIVAGYGKLPLAFESNQGQSAKEVKFLAHGPGYGLFLTPSEAVLTLHKRTGAQSRGTRGHTVGKHAFSAAARQPAVEPPLTVRLKLLGANPHPAITGLDALPGKVNYLRGNDRKRWHTNIPTYRRVKYAEVYPGIDLIYYGNPQQVEHDFVVAPGTDPSVIAMAIDGADKLSVDTHGDLVLASPAGAVRFEKPVIYQEVNGGRQMIAGAYVLTGTQGVRFQVGAYDTTRPLVVDPVLVYATYLGGSSGWESGEGIAVDSAGSAYVAGYTASTDFPQAGAPPQSSYGGGTYDAFVAKINAAGNAIVYATYLGGSNSDLAYGVAVDGDGNAYVTGQSWWNDFPLTGTPPLYSLGIGGGGDVFVAKLNAVGNELIYLTNLGGSRDDYGEGLAVDNAGNAYVTGHTGSSNFPVFGSPLQSTGGYYNYDAFVTKLNAAGSALVYSTYLGGSLSDAGRGIAVDSSGNAYVTGNTASNDFPGTSGSTIQSSYGGDNWDAFVAKVNTAGSELVYSTYLGGRGGDYGAGIAVDGDGNAYVTGFTQSDDFPLAGSPPLKSTFSVGAEVGPVTYEDAFVSKLNPTGSALVYSTYLSGSGWEEAADIAVDGNGNAYVTGVTNSPDLPLAGSPSLRGLADAFVTKLNATGSALVFSRYLGGSGWDEGRGIAVDGSGNAYVTGYTQSSDFQGTSSSTIQSSYGGDDSDAFVAKIGETRAVGPPVDYPVGSRPISIAAGDLDSDGDVDLVVSNTYSDSVSVLFNEGNGAFASAVDYPVGSNPETVKLGDFDNDGDLDVATANLYSNNVSVLWNAGNGAFGAPINYPVGLAGETSPQSVAVGDFDEDGSLDLVATEISFETSEYNSLVVFLNQGDGTFAPPVPYAIGITGPHAVATADVDNDGDLDIVVTNRDAGTIFVYANSGNGTFAAPVSYSAGSAPEMAIAADVDRDGNLDLVTPNSFGTVSWLRNIGDGTFALPQTTAVQGHPAALAVGDINRDGDLDVVVASFNAYDPENMPVEVLSNDGSGVFTFLGTFGVVGQGARSVVVADLDGNGSLDIAAPIYFSDIVSVFLNKSSVAPPTIVSFTATPISGTAPIVGVSISFSVTVTDPSKVQSVTWDFDGDGTVDQTTNALTTQFAYAAAGTFTAMVTVIDADGGEASSTTTVTVQSAAQVIESAITLVQQLPLNEGQQTSLTAKLNAVSRYLAQGDISDACNALVAEVNQVNALVRSRRLSAEDAEALLSEVQSIQTSLGCL